MSSFATWFESKYRRTDEPRSTAAFRLHVETGVSPMTIRRAIAGSRIRPEPAQRLASLTGGAVSPGDLVLAPTAKELRETG